MKTPRAKEKSISEIPLHVYFVLAFFMQIHPYCITLFWIIQTEKPFFKK